MGLTVCLFITLGGALPTIILLLLWAIYWKRSKPLIWITAFIWTDLQFAQPYIAFYRRQPMMMWFSLSWAGLVS